MNATTASNTFHVVLKAQLINMIFQPKDIVSQLLVVALFLSSCSTSKELREFYPNLKEKDFIRSYRAAFICGCLNAGSNENFNKFLKENDDPGLFSEVEHLSHGVVKEADSLGRVYAKKVQPINYQDAGNGRPFFSNCLYFSQSEDVLSFIKDQYKKLRRGKLTYDYEN